MSVDKKYELFKSVAAMPNRIRQLKPWESAESAVIWEDLQKASEALGEPPWEPFRKFVRDIQEFFSRYSRVCSRLSGKISQ